MKREIPIWRSMREGVDLSHKATCEWVGPIRATGFVFTFLGFIYWFFLPKSSSHFLKKCSKSFKKLNLLKIQSFKKNIHRVLKISFFQKDNIFLKNWSLSKISLFVFSQVLLLKKRQKTNKQGKTMNRRRNGFFFFEKAQKEWYGHRFFETMVRTRYGAPSPRWAGWVARSLQFEGIFSQRAT